MKMSPSSKLTSPIFVLSIVVVLFPTGIAGSKGCKLRTPIELVMIIDSSGSVRDSEFQQQLNTVRRVPDLFPMGPNEMRVAVVIFSTYARTLVSLTADANSIRTVSATYDGGDTQTHYAFNKAKEEFELTRPGALKIIILLTNGYNQNPEDPQRAAQERRKEGCLIYIAYFGTVNPYRMYHMEDMVHDRVNQLYKLDDFDRMAEEIVCLKECEFKKGCGYDNQQKCHYFWYQAYHLGTCTNQPPLEVPFRQCSNQDCDQACDQWPWAQDPPCGDPNNAGRTVDVGREGQMPSPKAVFKTCEPTKQVVCPTLPTTPTTPTTRTTTTTTTTTTKTTTSTSSTTTTSTPATTTTSTTTTATTTTPTTTKTTRTTPKRKTTPRPGPGPGPVPATDGEESTAATKDGVASRATSSEKPLLETWHIALIIVIPLLLLLVICILIACVVCRRRKKRKPAYDHRSPAHHYRDRRGPSSPGRTGHGTRHHEKPPHYFDAQPRRRPILPPVSAPSRGVGVEQRRPSLPSTPRPSRGEAGRGIDHRHRHQSRSPGSFNPAIPRSTASPRGVGAASAAVGVSLSQRMKPPQGSRPSKPLGSTKVGPGSQMPPFSSPYLKIGAMSMNTTPRTPRSPFA